MVERGQDLRLATEPVQPVGIVSEGRRQDLQRNFATQVLSTAP
jgi:hypothetical protein